MQMLVMKNTANDNVYIVQEFHTFTIAHSNSSTNLSTNLYLHLQFL